MKVEAPTQAATMPERGVNEASDADDTASASSTAEGHAPNTGPTTGARQPKRESTFQRNTAIDDQGDGKHRLPEPDDTASGQHSESTDPGRTTRDGDTPPTMSSKPATTTEGRVGLDAPDGSGGGMANGATPPSEATDADAA